VCSSDLDANANTANYAETHGPDSPAVIVQEHGQATFVYSGSSGSHSGTATSEAPTIRDASIDAAHARTP
jgi:hypothetical protein